MYTLTKKTADFFITVLIILIGAKNCICAENNMVCGAYIAKNADYADSIAEYEELCGVKNSIYLLNTNKGYPKDKVIECYACGKIPMLIVSGKTRLGQVPLLAEAAGEYGLPMYVCIGGSLDFYKYCVDIFRAKNKNIKFVQPVMLSSDTYEFAGIDYADMLAVTATITENSDYAEICRAAEYADVPVMLNLAVCGYNSYSHSYQTFAAIRALDYIYDLKKVYPDKLFGINYINIKNNGRNYEVYTEQRLRTVYGGLVCKWGRSDFGLEEF